MFAIELWRYTFLPTFPPTSPPCFIWVHNHNDLSNGPKMPFFLLCVEKKKATLGLEQLELDYGYY